MNDRDREAVASVELPWLNGWPRGATTVLIGTTIHCLGCGATQGGTCVDRGESWVAPGPVPTSWPFPEAGCPVCYSARFLHYRLREVAIKGDNWLAGYEGSHVAREDWK